MENLKMELCRDIFTQGVMQGKIQISFDGTAGTMQELIEGQCYNALQKIKTILEDDSLDDKECFRKIEEIICVFEDIGSNCGYRHDFG